MEKSDELNIRTVVLRVIAFIMLVPISYCLFVGAFFFAIPSISEDSQKTKPYYGYSHPLNLVEDADS